MILLLQMNRRPRRDKKPVVIFDPSAEKMPAKSDDLKVKVVEEVLNNPWDVPTFEAFMFFECPQCSQCKKPEGALRPT